MRKIFFFLFALFVTSACFAQQQVQSFQKDFENFVPSDSTQKSEELNLLNGYRVALANDSNHIRANDSLYQLWMRKQLEVNIADANLRLNMAQYILESRTENYSVYRWQYVSTIIIFFLVIIIVLSGVVYSALQFTIAYKHMKEKSAQQLGAATVPAPTEDVTNIKLSLQGVEISSSIFGIITLALSIVFFYLYMVYVYPVSEVGANKSLNSSIQTTSNK